MNKLAALQVGAELEADLAGALVAELALRRERVLLGGRHDAQVLAIVALAARVEDLGLEKLVHCADGLWLFALMEKDKPKLFNVTAGIRIE